MGLSAGQHIEAAYRLESGQSARLDLGGYARMLSQIKNQAGGCFSVASVEDQRVRFVTTQCPFTDGATDKPYLCQLATSTFGTIAARNFGYAKIALTKRMICDDRCEVWICTDPGEGSRHAGEEYRAAGSRIVSSTTSGSAEPRAQVYEIWRTKTDPSPAEAGRSQVIIGQSESIRRVLQAVETIAPTLATVLVTGETGVGKELLARSLHAQSGRGHKPFVAVNCGAIPEGLIESALFGHERGAFTGAQELHRGVFERAEGGTLFLDELDTLPLSAQTRLLRVLQEGEYERVGGRQTLFANVRVIAATNCQLEQAVKLGTFRRDLYYRVNVVSLAVPPLRERPEDIPLLVDYILAKLRRKHHKFIHSVSSEALRELLTYSWPGNVRELENVLERSFLFATDAQIEQVDLGSKALAVSGPARCITETPWREYRKQAMGEFEKNFLKAALKRHRGNVAQVAKVMDLTPRVVYLKLQMYSIDADDYRD